MTILPSPRSARALPLLGVLLILAGPAAAADFQLDNVRLDLGKFVLSMPKLDVKGAALDRAGFLAIFQAGASGGAAGGVGGALSAAGQAVQGGGGDSAVARMSKLTASEISAPTLVLEQSFGTQKQITTYRDIRFSEIKEGRIGRGEASGGSIKVEGAIAGPMSGEIKRISFDTLDLTQIARIFSEKAAPGATPPMQPIYGRIEQDGYSLDLGELGKMSAGKATLRNFKARVAVEPMGELMARIATLSEESEKARRNLNSKEEPKISQARDRQIGAAMLALIDAIDYGSGEVRDIVMALKAPKKSGAGAEAVDMRMARVAFGEDTPAKSGFVMEGLQFESGGAKGSLASIGYSGFSLGPMLKELQAALADPVFNPDNFDFRRFIPVLGTIKISGLQVDAPQEKRPGQPAAGTIRVGIGNFELKAAEQLNGIPTSLSLTLDNLTVPMVEGGANPSAKDLLAMGFKSVDLSAKIDLAWQEASSEFAIRTLSLGGVGMAKIEATGTLGNIGKDVFASDLALAQVALLGATAKGVEIRLQNLGLVEKLIENEARKSKRKVEDVRREYATIASLGLASILGPSEGAKALAGAVSRFAAKPGTLTVSAKAKAASGLGLADVIALGDPTEIFEKIDLKANAE